MTINFNNGFDDFYFIEKDLDANIVKFPDQEVQAVKWASEKEILKLLDEKNL